MHHVQYFGPFAGKWTDYVAPTFNARPRVHADRSEAVARMERLKRDHPNDQFRVISDEELKRECEALTSQAA